MMQIEKILNNNVVQALDNNVEYIVMGKGLGFQKKVGDFVDKEKIEKTFVLENTEVVEEWSRVYVNLPDGEMQVFLNILTFAEAIDKNLKVMDMTAFTLSQENHLPIIVFDMNKKGNLAKVVAGENVGTVVND